MDEKDTIIKLMSAYSSSVLYLTTYGVDSKDCEFSGDRSKALVSNTRLAHTRIGILRKTFPGFDFCLGFNKYASS